MLRLEYQCRLTAHQGFISLKTGGEDSGLREGLGFRDVGMGCKFGFNAVRIHVIRIYVLASSSYNLGPL